MAFRSRSRRIGLPAVASLAIVGIGLAGVGSPAVAAQTAPPGPAAGTANKAPATGPDVRVTLITGDRVTVRGGDATKATIEPGPGRDKIVFNTYRTKQASYVIPSDVGLQLATGQLDRRLFDVAGLIKAGYDDKSSSSIPLLVTYKGKAKRSAPIGATVTRQLPAIDGAAVKVDKKNAGPFLAGTALTGTAKARSASGVDKIWLDGKRKAVLDQSVPQIGGPAAWQAGYTGKGVTVAVLDTGIDATHPDLATQLAGAKNFTGESADDVVGHGTHVASTIAGTGAASDGKYKGVAPDAKLYDGKVCEVWGCQDSVIVAAMEWAATEVKADVVNLSLGGQDFPEIDPLEEAVNRLTAATGTLFVIAAGNDGPGDSTVGSPGSADAALTVGAVDKQDQLADFSSRGPRIGDGAVKPDVSAPGVSIVAAKSKDATIGEPVGDQYLNLSGTSMATPHTAGAAALLLQQHPSWKANELKGTLMASAKVAAGQTSFQQGAGRIDLTTAIKQTVIAEPGSVSFGVASFPHTDDEPVTKDVTYRNLGDQPVTLALTASMTTADGTAAPAGALTLSANTLTVPAGGTASVKATSDTKHTGPDGLYSGRITATAEGTSVVVPVGVNKEGESYTLTVKLIRADGTPDDQGPALLVGVGNDTFQQLYDPSGTVQVRLPKGEYVLDQFQEFAVTEEDYQVYKLAAPSVQLTSDQTVVLDARKAKAVTTTVPNPEARQALSDIGYDRYAPNGELAILSGMSGGSGKAFTLSTGPALPAAQLTGHVISQWGAPGADGRFTNTPYLYGIANSQPGEFVTGFHRTVKAEDLAVVDQTMNATTSAEMYRAIFPVLPGVTMTWTRLIRVDLPRTIRYYLDDVQGGWTADLLEIAEGRPPRHLSMVTSDPVKYRAGRTYRERWNAAAFVPKVNWFSRTGADLSLWVGKHGDADGHGGTERSDSASSKLYRNGEEVASADSFGYLDVAGLPAGKAAYKLVMTGTRTDTAYSRRTDLTVTFSSAATGEKTALPARTVRYQPDVDSRNTVKRTPVTVLPVVLDGTPGATLPTVKKVEVQVSGDDGKTWKAATVVRSGAGYKAIFATPAGATVSLKAHVVDAAGNTTDQTVIGAYPLR
ncbi:S8 family serine peptidase [Kribbella catacumbae]|uniref:S8 family serine peptidase n=1 Tax=Kribbella catacumbae TaxID=460086 RepID=UPI000363CC45|nr:S8 family serine peptidase [Kribbella catacumbae]